MPSLKMPPFQYINRQREWEKCVRELQRVPQLAIDLEANGMFAYREQMCLIQLSTRTQDYIVDPLADIDLTVLGELVADPAVEKVLHAAEYDLILMKREYDWQMHNLFDTMWAARILGVERIGLANVLQSWMNVKVDKKFQRANWAERPLSKAQLAYAQADTHFLLPLRDKLGAALEKGGHLEESADIFTAQTNVRLPDTDFKVDSFWSINGIDDLTPHQKGILRALNIYRDEEARKRDRPPFKIFGDRTLVEIAATEPRNMHELRQLKKLSKWQTRRYGRQILRLVALGQDQSPPKRKRRQRTPDAILTRYENLRQWRKQRAAKRGVASDVIVSRDLLWELATVNPQSEAELTALDNIGPWQRATYGPEIIEVLQS